jgi:hypothetical protein
MTNDKWLQKNSTDLFQKAYGKEEHSSIGLEKQILRHIEMTRRWLLEPWNNQGSDGL